MRAVLPLLGLALLAACGESGPTVLQNEAQQAATAASLQGWDRVFGAPAETIGRVNQFGYHAAPYAADGPTFLSKGGPITLSQSDAQTPNTGRFEAAGATAAKIDRLVFTLSLTDRANEETAKKRFVEVLRGFLSQYGIDDEGGFDAIASGQSADGPIGGAPSSIDVTNGPDGSLITVTFTRPTGTTPVFPDQGQADGNRA